MQAENPFQTQLVNLFDIHNPSPAIFSKLTGFLQSQCKEVNHLILYIQALIAQKPFLINFNSFCKFMRIIKKKIAPLKNNQVQILFSKLLLSHAHLYFPYWINHTNENEFQQYLNLFKDIAVSRPQGVNNNVEVLVYLSKNIEQQQWSNELIEKINNQALVDKKSQNYKFIKLSKFHSNFIVKNFEKFIPSLERLLVRSELNIQVWEEFFVSVSSWKGIDPHSILILNKIKYLFVNHPEPSIKIFNAISKDLSNQNAVKDIIAFLTNLINSQHNAKKKINYIRMISGVIDCLKKHSDLKLKDEYAQELLVTLINGFVKFNQQEEFNLLVDIVNKLLRLIVQPKDQIAKALKLYLKTQNKYILLLSSLIMATVYNQEHIDALPSVKQIFAFYKSQLQANLKKIQANWQWIVPQIYFLSHVQTKIYDFLSQSLPIFKVSAVSLSQLQKEVIVKLIIRYFEYLKNEEEQISDHLYVISIILLEELKDQQVWSNFFKSLQTKDKISLITKGLFPVITFPCHEHKKNKGNQYNSLTLYCWSSMKKQKVELETSKDYFKFVSCFSHQQDLLKKEIISDKKHEALGLIQTFYLATLYENDFEDEQKLTNDKQLEKIKSISKESLVYDQSFIVKLLRPFTEQDYYLKDLEFLAEFTQRIISSVKQSLAFINEVREPLIQRGFYKLEQVKPKKIYLNPNYEVKMMSEQQVKAEKYRQHFLKMASLFEKIIQTFHDNINNHDLLNSFWQTDMKKLLKITKFPQHRLSISKIIKRSCEFTSNYNKREKESRLFIKYSSFLGDFFCLRNSSITPTVKLMHSCESFLKQFLEIPFEAENQHIQLFQNLQASFIMHFINEMCLYLLENMEFDVSLKKLSIKVYHKCLLKGINFNNEDLLYNSIVHNINILASSEHIQIVLLSILEKIEPQKYKYLFTQILNFILSTKKVILSTITALKIQYKPQFEQFIKLKILVLESNQQISNMANKILEASGQLNKSILTFNMKNFVKKNSKETIEKLCIFIKEQITAQTAQPIFNMVMKASEQLFDENFDQEGLQMFPFFLDLNIEYITQSLFKPIFQLLITKFTAKEEFGTLTKMAMDVGIRIIKRNAEKHAEKLLLVLESFINKSGGVSNIIFLGVLAPYVEGNKNLQIIQKRITELFKSNKESQQKAISKCMPDLMSFFKQPLDLIENLFNSIGAMTTDSLQIGQSYLYAGLLKGVGYKETLNYIDKILASTYVTKTKQEKSGRIYLIHAMIENFGRVIQIKSIKIIQILIGYMADGQQDIRNISKRAGQNLIVKMSSFSVKILLPALLRGLEEEQNWRVKISYIWILGIMANCSARQLQTSLPVIVPTLSTCLSNAHPTIRQKASQALNLIGQTIKNPQISQCVDILIQALENPFEKSQRAIDILLKTIFNHYIDPPSFSLIIPILDYCMRGRSSDLKAGACQVIGSIVQLIANAYDLLPYLRIIITGLKTALCDPLQEIRCIASMAIGKISAKIGMKQAQSYFQFVVEIMESSTSNTTERQGAAQAYSEIICSHSYEYFEESIYKIFDKLKSMKHSEKEGYILVFLYVPSIRTQQFEGFIKQVNENMYEFVSDEEENIRNSAMMVEKVLINNYCLSHTDLLLGPLCDGVFEANWKKRNAALILIGQLLNIIKSHMYNTRSTDKAYAYYRGLMAVYVIKDDELQMTRNTANQIWNTYIENTPKTIKSGLSELVKMWTRWTHSAGGVIFSNIVAFSSKYGQNYFTEIMENLGIYLSEPEHQVGVFEVLAEFIKRLSNQFLSKQNYKQTIRAIFQEHLFTISDTVLPALSKCLALYIEKMHEQKYFQDLLHPMIEKMDHTDESNVEYTVNLHLIKNLLNTSSKTVVDRVINKIMESPMSEFKIQVITNNAEKLANFLYSHFKPPATELLIEQLYLLFEDSTKQNRFSLIIYCLEQVSLRLSKKYKAQFVKSIKNNINKCVSLYEESGRSARYSKILNTFVNMLIFFLNSTPLAEIEDLQTIIGQISPLIFLQDEKLRVNGHKIYLLMISDNKNIQTSEYIRQMVVSLGNKLTKENELIWQDETIFKDYVLTMVKGIAYGKEEVMEESLEMIKFMMKHTPRAIVQKEIMKIIGPIVRVCNYPLFQKQKLSIIEVLITILKQSFNVEAFNNQILSVCYRLLLEFKMSEDVVETVGNVFFQLLKGSVLKAQLILSIMSKISIIGPNLVHSFYYLVKYMIDQNVQIPKNIYQKIYEDTNNFLTQNQHKLPVKGLYYASKINARIGNFLNKPLQKIQSQLEGVTCSYETVINYLHYAYYKKKSIVRMKRVQVYIRESNREKVYYLLKSLRLCTKRSEQTKKLFSQEYLNTLVPQGLSGFEEIYDEIGEFMSEKTEAQLQAQINE